MAKQRYIQDSFWTDPYIETLKPDEKLLFIYYLTNPLCNIAGIYEIRDTRVAYETGVKDVSRIKEKFKRDGKVLILKDWIILNNFAKHQSLNPNVKEGMQRIVNELPSEVKALKGFERLSHFTLLNLTYIPLKRRGKIKDMKTFNLETGQYEEEIKTKGKNKEAIELAKTFDSMASNYTGRPIITPKSYFIVLNAMNKHKMKFKGIEQLFKDWFQDPKIKSEDKVKLSFALSANNINSWKTKN